LCFGMADGRLGASARRGCVVVWVVGVGGWGSLFGALLIFVGVCFITRQYRRGTRRGSAPPQSLIVSARSQRGTCHKRQYRSGSYPTRQPFHLELSGQSFGRVDCLSLQRLFDRVTRVFPPLPPPPPSPPSPPPPPPPPTPPPPPHPPPPPPPPCLSRPPPPPLLGWGFWVVVTESTLQHELVGHVVAHPRAPRPLVFQRARKQSPAVARSPPLHLIAAS